MYTSVVHIHTLKTLILLSSRYRSLGCVCIVNLLKVKAYQYTQFRHISIQSTECAEYKPNIITS